MLIAYVLVISFVLAADSFAASISCGMYSSRSKVLLGLKVGLAFGIFQAGMLIAGWSLGTVFRGYIEAMGYWLSSVILLVVGGKMILEALRSRGIDKECLPLSNRSLVWLSLATSLDALAVGITFGFLGAGPLFPLIVVGLVTFWMSFIGVLIGNGLRKGFGKAAEVIAGMILIALGVKILLEHLL